MKPSIEEKYHQLGAILNEMGSVLVAFSGGVDSTLLLKAARDVLGERVIAVTAVSPTLPAHELDEARTTARALGAEHVTVTADELGCPEFAANPPERCYHCKKVRFAALNPIKEARSIAWIVEGANADDEGDWRPGMKAASELGIRSPLLEAGFTKDDIRKLSARLGLPTWDKPSMACLASRIPYGEAITEEKLCQIAQAEDYLRALGFKQVRVRHHGEVARIEVPKEDLSAALERADAIVSRLKENGFYFVALDLAGFKSGSMNAVIDR